MTGTEPASGDGALNGVRALVTGASRGIGREVSRLLAVAGARVGMVARTAGELERVASEVGGHPIPGDVSHPSEVSELARRFRETVGGPPDIVVSAAGGFALAAISDTDPGEFERQIGANLFGPFLVIRCFLPGMMRRGAGHIVNIGSVAGRIALPGNGAYAASKYGLRGLHEVLAEEVRGTGVRATLIEPSATDTPLWDPLDPDARSDLPSRAEMLRPEDVARAVLYAVRQPAGVEVSLLAIRRNG